MNAYRFGRIEVRPVERQLLVEGRAVPVGSRAFDVLLALIERRERVVTKGELIDIVWAGLVVEEGNLPVQVAALRKVLGSGAVTTIPGRGYRFSLAMDAGVESPHDAPGTLAHGLCTNLPASTEALIGRDADLLDLASLVGEHRLVTVLGAGGIGKTRLAQEVARGIVDRFSQGVWWVDLAAISTAEKIAHTVGNSANVRLDDGDAPGLLGRALADRELLLVLDNCEHLASAVAHVARSVLEAAPKVRILATSQESLKVPGEYLYRLEPLAVPAPGTLLNKARTFSAVQLLEQRAKSVDRRFSLDEDNVAAAIELCRHLDGIALAIEMAAARLPVLGLDPLNARLGERLRLLRNIDTRAPARYQTLRATLDWSYSLLTDGERALLRRLAAFVGTFRLETAQRVASDMQVDEWQSLDTLAALVDKSLVRLEQSDPPRYRLPETVRLYALDQLDRHGETEAALRAHGQAMAQLGVDARRVYWETPDAEWMAQYTPDYDDLQAAFERAVERQDAEVASMTVGTLTLHDMERDASRTRDRKVSAYAMIPIASPLGQARLWTCITAFQAITIPQVDRLQAARARVDAWRKLDDPRQLYMALARLASYQADAGDFDAADRSLVEARALADPAWPLRMRWQVAHNEAIVGQYCGDTGAMRAGARMMLVLADQLGSKGSAAVARYFFARAALIDGDLRESILLLDASAAELRAAGLTRMLGFTLSALCGAHLRTGDFAAARAAAEQASPLVLRTDSPRLLDHIALLSIWRNRHTHAALLLGHGDSTRETIPKAGPSIEALSAEEATAAVDEVFAARERECLRNAGARLTHGEADAMMREVLELA